ncbi:MAG: cytochrome c3 family protein, partial [Chlorobi bacterium]|nr:cytochrome c3 family protein [Chlorobiota bacterium]
MNNLNHKKLKIRFIFYSVVLLLFYGCAENAPFKDMTYTNEGVEKSSNQSQDIAVSAPMFHEEGIYPCSDCHADMEVNTKRRPLVDMHEEIDKSFTHDRENRWCLDCHNTNNRDYLHLANGKLLKFQEAYKLCGQCHGDKYRDWKVGGHGKRTGYWNG